ncbi:hypothetical protein [Micromonospora sp. NBC_00617]
MAAAGRTISRRCGRNNTNIGYSTVMVFNVIAVIVVVAALVVLALT